MRQRYFATSISHDEIVVSKEDEHHITNVMRKHVGDELFFSYEEKSYVGRIDSLKPLKISLLYEEKEDNELPLEVTLYLCSLKKDKNEFVIQKACEMGVDKLVFVNSSRVVNHMSKEDLDHHMERYNKIIKEACEQSQRSHLLEIGGVISLSDVATKCDSDLKLVPYEREEGGTSALIDALSHLDGVKSIALCVGSEGGFTSEEVELLKRSGFLSVSLGKRILRSETAALYALSVIDLYVEKN
ncbi:MAG: 16S rRNA (uracil(1498)-N(3))-methyltransferase [Coprobacillus sp.]|nr:16S rRNA (uracil(1498)-N(3))-methyltransferase [Coprobacillus sp.]